ncbi:YqcI/YcgG family protein [Frankia sp. AgB1.9]|uniref:YqcI/YcgG family protein n=1 Tax=unclassified Frankia TaxID=2632575 RepID=UPI001933536B|nr:MULTISPECIES: YqcI/YcgG family protein [unclassified Frankia]MBL7488743.1 YqcI/YcgG family protein [Frankia sp. AgW1.1]MBL7546576.1 YqcI/YcgG family protein [Frankia sp. AgB1.9]MBL7625054.1 YqcI/YcgG family protein [Frankia sp. AgB1.8]
MRDILNVRAASTPDATGSLPAEPLLEDAFYEEALDLAVGPMPAWGAGCARDMITTLKSEAEPFPCVFAVAAANSGGLRFGFVDDLYDEQTWSVLPDILASYLATYQSISRNTSLVVFFGSGNGTAGQESDDVLGYERRFWSLLRYLHDSDGEPWPSDIPTDTDDPAWEFSFRGSPIFVVCNTPAHRRLRSRSNPVFNITFQPRWVFEGLAPTTPRGAAARKVIRERLRRMDEVDSTPLLGSYGDPANREWKQYFLRDDATVAEKCPFRAKWEAAGHPPVAAHDIRANAAHDIRASAAHGARAQQAHPVPDDPTPDGEPSPRLFKVVVNQEQQYSVWPQERGNALGWFDTPVTGTRNECLDSIELTWSDLRPRSLRRRMSVSAGAGSR